MSAEDASGGDKAPASAPAPKPAAATFSSFINKNTTGKKFAPKAARRRPGAAAPAPAPAPTPTPSAAPETPAATAESQTSQTQLETSHAPVTEAPNVLQLPTPAATQEPAAETASQPAPSTAESSTALPQPTPTPTPTEPLPTPAPASTETQTQAASESHVAVPSSTDPGLTTQYLEDAGSDGRSPKRRRIEEPEVEATVDTPAPASAYDGGEQNIDPNLEASTADAQALPQPRKRRTLPWAAVNHPPEGEEDAAAAEPTRKPRQPPKPRAKKNVTADPDADHVAQEDGDEEEAQPTRKRPAAKPRAKKKATEATAQDGEGVPAPPKKARKPRKPREALSSEIVQGTEDEVGRIADDIVAAATRRKPKAKRRKATPEGDEVDGIEGEEGTRKEKKRKGRPPREPTPSDAEDQTIDPDVTYMDSLAARTVRIGKLSALEKQMRTIDWDAVKQRRREEDNKKVISREEQEKADAALAAAGAELAAAQVEQGPRLRLNADGVMELVPDSGVIDREGDADRIINEMVVTEDQDITARLTTRSFMKNNKRFPNEFLLPGQGRRWNDVLTKKFYEALESFGTDFQMISQMFPGFTRRSIKTKFTREERENPDRVREALQGRCKINEGGWDKFLMESEKTEESFADADKIKRELAEHEAEMREKIAAAQAEAQERKRQREIAGVDADGNPLGDGTNKENGKGKKKRGKNKQVAFQEEQGVEIVGEIGDDDTWGQE
ncbi:hypothetical protein CC77DRAFT_1021011 [Alternaria alternata]|uniref:Transcription factor TFIIIB component B'' Myb domain-containing protein n=1 Tax=Alternaria alternata TaxID=5599 RepID=A0A177DK93_ALTAL|nr:hypothetical protein CC77DRAFT_1021011 [Alternaria alternata]OAG19620.1 hypothetical protein CC77DRAFT_1021011 [Alternaria alternata]